MSNNVYPVLPGLTFGNTRIPNFNTGVQQALSGKESRISYQLYPLMTFELQYELLRDDITTSELKALTGLFNACQGQYDTFLFNDPAFNTVVLMQFATGDGATTSFQVTATYQNAGGPGAAEIIQNFNGAPVLFIDRFTGTLQELLTTFARTNFLLQSQALATTWGANGLTPTNNNQVAPDDTTTGTKLLETATTAQHFMNQAAAAIPSAVEDVTFSIWVEANFTRTWCALLMFEATGGTVVSQTFNLTGAGVVGATNATGANWSNLRAQIQQSGSFYRISITATKTNAATSVTAELFVSNADSLATYLGVTADGLTAWGAQLEVAPTGTGQPTLYLPTTVAAVTQIDYAMGATGIAALNFVPPAASLLSWSGSFFYRCRFADDTLSNEQFMNKWWQNQKVTLRQVKL